MRDERYLAKRKANPDRLWNEHEKYLYYSYKNKEYILPTIIACFLFAFIRLGILSDIIILIYVFCLCKANNYVLDHSEQVQKEREYYKEYRRKCYNEVIN